MPLLRIECVRCGAKLDEDQVRCPVCELRYPIESTCIRCGALSILPHTSCPKCRGLNIIAFPVIFLLIAFSFGVYLLTWVIRAPEDRTYLVRLGLASATFFILMALLKATMRYRFRWRHGRIKPLTD